MRESETILLDEPAPWYDTVSSQWMAWFPCGDDGVSLPLGIKPYFIDSKIVQAAVQANIPTDL